MRPGRPGEVAQARIDALHAAIDQLTPRQREALDWCDIKGLSLREAARRMNCSSNTVKRHRDGARARLKSLLERGTVLDIPREALGKKDWDAR